MADTPDPVRKSSPMPYVWAGVILFLLGVVLIFGILWLRPTLDPLLVITPVLAFFASIFTGVAAFLKSNETHLTVNSQLSEWKIEHAAMARSQGIIDGMAGEQARIATQKSVLAQVEAARVGGGERRTESLLPSSLLAAVAAKAPVAVVVQNPEPLPVVVADPAAPVSVVVENKEPVPVAVVDEPVKGGKK